MDELERLRMENERLRADLDLAVEALACRDGAFQQMEDAVDFWRMAAIAYRDRAERAERAALEAEWDKVDATMYDWSRAMVRHFLPLRFGMND